MIVLKTSHCFSSLHHCSFSRMIFTLVFVKLAHKCSCTHAQTYSTVPCHHVLSSVNMASCLVARRIQCSVARFVVTG